MLDLPLFSPSLPITKHLGCVFVGDFFTHCSSSMVNHHQTTIGENMFETFPKHQTSKFKKHACRIVVSFLPKKRFIQRFFQPYHLATLISNDPSDSHGRRFRIEEVDCKDGDCSKSVSSGALQFFERRKNGRRMNP